MIKSLINFLVSKKKYCDYFKIKMYIFEYDVFI